jgi:ribosomal protein S18 acetylase RimI-like enzyme
MGKTGGKSMNEPRPYLDQRDLESMRNLLVQGRKADNGTYYVHMGDLTWWLYYPPLEGDFWDHVHLWDDPELPGRLLGWALISPDWVGIDVYFQPELRGSLIAREMYLWAEEQAMRIAREQGKKTVYVLWVLHDDEVLVRHFNEQGYRLARGYVHLSRILDNTIPPAHLTEGFVVRGCMGEREGAARARAQYGAFASSAPFEHYLERFTKFMRSPVYSNELDIVAVAPDEQIGAFCIVWIDPINKVGLFEPVGTYPNFQRKGLGKAVMLEGLRRMQERGMKSAIVSTGEDNLPAIKLYESIGFRVVNKLGTYEKDV